MKDQNNTLSLSAETAWNESFLPISHQEWIQHAKAKLAASSIDMPISKLLHVILMILRNLSFVAANARCMAYNNNTLLILCGCLHESSWNDSEPTTAQTSSSSNLAFYALHTLLSLSPLLDISGQSYMRDKLFLEEHLRNTILPEDSGDVLISAALSLSDLGWGGMQLAKKYDSKEDTLEGAAKMLLENNNNNDWKDARAHLGVVYVMFASLRFAFTHPKSPRHNIMLCLEILKEWLDIAQDAVLSSNDLPSMSRILQELPNDMLERLVDCLYVPRLGPDAMDYVNPVCNVVTRVNPLKLLMGYDNTVDTDLRDRALDVLVPWLSLNKQGAARLTIDPTTNQTRTRLYDALVPALTTRMGRSEAAHLAFQVFRALSTCEKAKVGLEYCQERLVELASRDARVAQLVFTHLYGDNEEEGLEGGESGQEEGSDEEEDDSQDDEDME
jgi:hypothetical protein